VARVVIEIDGDSSGAEEALGATKDAVEDLGTTSEGSGSAIGGLNTRLINATAGANLFSMGVGALRTGVDMLWESTERYFQSSEDGQEKWEALERQGRALKGMLFELFIGTNDQNEAFDRMSEFLGDLVAGARGAMQILQPMANLLRGALSAGARAVAAAFGDAGSMTGQFADQLDTASDELTRLQELLDRQNDVVGEALTTLDHYGQTASHALADVADTMAAVDGMEFDAGPMTVGFDEATARFQQNVADVLASATSLSDLDVPVSATFIDGTRVIGRGVDNLRDALESIEIEVEGRQMTMLEAYGSQLQATTALLDAEAEAASGVELSISATSRSAEEAVEVFGGLGGAMGVASMAAFQLATDQEFLEGRVRATTDAFTAQLIAEKVAAADSINLIAEQMHAKNEASKAEDAELLRMDALKDALDEKEATRAARQAERVNIAKGGFQALTNSALGMMTAQVKAGKKSRDEMRKLIGDELVALGAAGLAKAAMMIFEPGKQALAVGLGIASAAAIGLGAKMGSSASAGGAPAAPASAAQPATVTNVTFQNNFAQIGSREAFLRTTGDTFQQAVDEGYIAIPRG